MNTMSDYPRDFQECIEFHGHVCPGLAIGYAASKLASELLELSRAEDEELVAVVENDSCAVDAVQVMLGCTFGKGNFIFRDWGKQVFTFMDRSSGRAVRLSFTGELMGGSDERRALREKIQSGEATDEEREQFRKLRDETTAALVTGNPRDFFSWSEPDSPFPEKARIVGTQACDICGEQTVEGKLTVQDGKKLCKECSQ